LLDAFNAASECPGHELEFDFVASPLYTSLHSNMHAEEDNLYDDFETLSKVSP
jgi:hypothetical protein